jgi:recombination protein RecA
VPQDDPAGAATTPGAGRPETDHRASDTPDSASPVTNRRRAMDIALGQIERAFGARAVVPLDGDTPLDVSVISTGSLKLDKALGIGGLPRGRITEVYGPESSGKTTLALHTIASAFAADPEARCGFIDAEHALDLRYARDLDVDPARLLLNQPDSGEQALEITETLIRSNALDVIVIDSVAALVPRAELEGDMGADTTGSHARLMSQALRRMTGAIGTSRTVVLFLNQIRSNLRPDATSPETTTGGNALKFYASVRIECRALQPIRSREKVVGRRTRLKVVKNKLAAPFREAQVDIIFGEGICRLNELIEAGTSAGLLTYQDRCFLLDGRSIGRGIDDARHRLRDDLRLRTELRTRLLHHPQWTGGDSALASEFDAR